MSFIKPLTMFRPFKPRDYPYLNKLQWLRRELTLLGCRTGLWHFGPKKGVACWCDFWDAQ